MDSEGRNDVVVRRIPTWIKADVAITCTAAMVVAVAVARTFDSNPMGVFLLAMPFIVAAILLVSGATSIAGLCALEVLRRYPLRREMYERMVFTAAICMGFLVILLPWSAINLRLSSQLDPVPSLVLLAVAATGAFIFYPGRNGLRERRRPEVDRPA
jgi:hypothetical protein